MPQSGRISFGAMEGVTFGSPAAETVATDLKACNDQSGLGYTGRLQFNRCMTPRGYAVRSGD